MPSAPKEMRPSRSLPLSFISMPSMPSGGTALMSAINLRSGRLVQTARLTTCAPAAPQVNKATAPSSACLADASSVNAAPSTLTPNRLLTISAAARARSSVREVRTTFAPSPASIPAARMPTGPVPAPTTTRWPRTSIALTILATPVAAVPRHGRITAQLCFDYQGHRGWWAQGPTAVLVEGAGGRVLLQRDLAAEGDAMARLHALGIESLGSGGVFGIPGPQPQQAWLEWADEGFAVLRDAGFDLTTDAALDGWIARAPEIAVRLDAQSGDEATSPWFALSLGVEIDGRRHDILPWLPDLIAAAAAQPPDPATGLPTLPPHVFLQAPGGQGFVRLPTQALRPWMAALLELVGERAHDFTQGSLKLSRLEALRTSAVLGEGVVWEGADALRALARQLQGRAALPEVPVPPGVQASLRPYQQQGLNWLQFLRAHGLAGILADDMGLGKTLQTLAHIQVEKDAGRLTAPALVIAPVSLMGNWRREAERFCPGLRSLVLHGKDRHAVAHAMSEYDLVIAPYSLLQRDRERWLAAQWHLVVLDEAQNIKNASTHAAQVAASLQARHRLCLSGTP
ncbi:MAG: hypothetical protein HUU13_16575, partial [Burkholderiaceae bacterium]|nr:hypothetical protein [Burkholderiaceae bacterium]